MARRAASRARRGPPGPVPQLIEALRRPLQLGGDAPRAAAAGAVTAGLFNPVHPWAVQVLGDAGEAYLASLAVEAARALPARLFRRGMRVLVVAGDRGACDARPWQDAGVAVLRSPRPPHEVAYLARRALAARATRRLVHGVLLAVHGAGVLLEGPAASGKSSLALELLSRGHALVADDAVEVSRPARGILVGRAPGLLQGYLEARDLGVLDVRRMHGRRAVRAQCRLDLVIRLVPGRGRALKADERLAGRRSARRLLGEALPVLSLPAHAGRANGHNLAALVEAAALDRRLRLDGIEADAELARRQARAIESNP